MTESLSFTGERFLPGLEGEIGYEHWHRYLMASEFCRGRWVLDVACGEGYGSALMAKSANSVIGVDISAETIDHARQRYRSFDNIEFIKGTCDKLPLPDNSIDLAVSFETIEHIEEQEQFIQELKRVLKPNGLLIMSSPNKKLYTDERDYHNEFHVRELYRDEFDQLLGSEFPHVQWFGQKLLFNSAIWPEAKGFIRSEYLMMKEEGALEVDHIGLEAMYYIAVCALKPESLRDIENKLSLFGHSSEGVYIDYVYVTRRAIELEKQLAERDASLSEASAELERLTGENAELSQKLERSEGFAWWLKSPFRLLGRLFSGSSKRY